MRVLEEQIPPAFSGDLQFDFQAFIRGTQPGVEDLNVLLKMEL